MNKVKSDKNQLCFNLSGGKVFGFCICEISFEEIYQKDYIKGLKKKVSKKLLILSTNYISCLHLTIAVE